MSTLAEIRSNVADEINRNDLSTQIDRKINQAIEYFYNSEKFWFQETSSAFNTIVSQESYGTSDGLPSDIAEIDLALLTVTSTDKYPLTKRSFDWIKDVNEGISTGRPTDFAWYEKKLYLYLIPNEVKTITLYYTKTYPYLVNDADSNDYTVYAQDLIQLRAMYTVYQHILKDFESAMAIRTDLQEVLIGLRARSENTTMLPGQIKATIF